MPFGIFNSFWDGHPNHLPLLRLRINSSNAGSINLEKSLKRIDQIIANNSFEEIYEDGCKILAEFNWRPHLVLFITILKLEKPEQEKFVPLLWKRLCLGTWVSPQLLVTLSNIDADFKKTSKKIITNIGLQEFRTLHLNEQEIMQRKFNYEINDRKILNALRYLTTGEFLINEDDDNGGSIAKNWNEKVNELKKLGLILNQS